VRAAESIGSWNAIGKKYGKKAATGVIKPDTLPLTKGTAAQHTFLAYLQTRDWLLVQSTSSNLSDYG